MTNFTEGKYDSQINYQLLPLINKFIYQIKQLIYLKKNYFRLQATKNLLPSSDMMNHGREIVIRVTKARCCYFTNSLYEFFQICVNDVKSAISPNKNSSGTIKCFSFEINFTSY